MEGNCGRRRGWRAWVARGLLRDPSTAAQQKPLRLRSGWQVAWLARHRWPWLCWADRLRRRPLQKAKNGGMKPPLHRETQEPHKQSRRVGHLPSSRQAV